MKLSEEWINKWAEESTCSQLHSAMMLNISYGLVEMSSVMAIALVRRLRSLGCLQF